MPMAQGFRAISVSTSRTPPPPSAGVSPVAPLFSARYGQRSHWVDRHRRGLTSKISCMRRSRAGYRLRLRGPIPGNGRGKNQPIAGVESPAIDQNDIAGPRHFGQLRPVLANLLGNRVAGGCQIYFVGKEIFGLPLRSESQPQDAVLRTASQGEVFSIRSWRPSPPAADPSRPLWRPPRAGRESNSRSAWWSLRDGRSRSAAPAR